MNGDYPYYLGECPHCHSPFAVDKDNVNCREFICAQYKDKFDFVDPHLAQESINSLLNNGEIYGCGKKFYFDGERVEIR